MKKYEKLLYHANIIPSRLALAYLAFNTFQTIITLNAVNVSASGIRIMEIILLNIFLSFMVFITASEIKRYSLPWSRAGLGIGVFQCLRAFFISSTVSETPRLYITLSLLVSGCLLILSSGISIGISKKYLFAVKEQ
jgi:hypothetical protein